MKAIRYAIPGDVIEGVGIALYGQFWQRPLAQSLGVSGMSLRRWRMQRHGIPGTVLGSMAELLAEREVELTRTSEQLAAAAEAVGLSLAD
jgi:hypothetical protein